MVKSLGRLADQPRGRALIERQLQRFPDNISLLKHVAAIAVEVRLQVIQAPCAQYRNDRAFAGA